MPFGDGIDARVIRCLISDIQNGVGHAIGQRFDLTRFDTNTALAHSAIFTTRPHALGALACHDFLKRAVIAQLDRGAVDADHTVCNLNLFTRKTDQAFDIVATGYGVAEHDNIATLRLGCEQPRVVAVKDTANVFCINLDAETGRDNAGAGGIGITIGHLVHEQEITDQKRLFHRPGRDPERLEKQRAKHPCNQQRIDDCFDGFDKGVAGIFLSSHAGAPDDPFRVTCGQDSAKSSDGTRHERLFGP